MIKFIFLVNLFYLSSVFAELPSYFQVCGRRNPNLDACILKSVEAVRPTLAKGIPELKVPAAEPLFIADGFTFDRSADFQASAKNIKLWNATAFEASDFHADLDKQEFSFKLHFDQMKMEGDYQVDAKILVPIHGDGYIKIYSYGIDSDVILRYKLINTKKGQQLYFTSMSCKVKLDDYKSEFTARDQTSATLSDAINTVINSNRQEILEAFNPVLEKAISTKVLEIANSICKNFTYEELFPDRE